MRVKRQRPRAARTRRAPLPRAAWTPPPPPHPRQPVSTVVLGNVEGLPDVN